MSSHKKYREMLVQLLFSFDVGEGGERDEMVAFLMAALALTRKTVREGYARARAIFLQRERLDAKVALFSKGYALERIGRVERNVLRLIVFELEENVEPVSTLIAEGIRLTRKFASPDAATYVHALLDAIALSTRAEPAAQ